MDTDNPLEKRIIDFLQKNNKKSLFAKFADDAGSNEQTLMTAETEQQAGVVELTEDYACAFKTEPVYVEGIENIGEIFAQTSAKAYLNMMVSGSQPLCKLVSMSTSVQPEESDLKKAIADISSYGNTFGIPVLGGDIRFINSQKNDFTANILSIGLIDRFEQYENCCAGADNPVFLISAPVAEEQISSKAFSMRSLYEFICDLHDDKAIVAVQTVEPKSDVICACAAMAAKGTNGIELDMPPQIADNQLGKLVIVIKEQYGKKIQKTSRKWNVQCVKIGVVIEERKIVVINDKKVVVDLLLPDFDDCLPENKVDLTLPEITAEQTIVPKEYKEVGKRLITTPNLSSQRWIFEQFDNTIGTNHLSTNFISDAAVLQIKGIRHAVAVSFCQNNVDLAKYPQAANLVVADALHKIVCAGGVPRALTGCLNYGENIDNNVVDTINGHIAEFSNKIKIPFSGVNVNKVKAKGLNISMGAVGFILDKQLQMTMSFKSKGDMIYMLGSSTNNINASEYIRNYHNITDSAPQNVDLDEEAKLLTTAQQLISRKLVNSAHNVSKGGLFKALLESAMVRSFGFDVTVDAEIRKDAFLFGESPTRIIASVAAARETNFIDYMIQANMPFITLGHVTREEIRVDDISYGFISDYKKLYKY